MKQFFHWLFLGWLFLGVISPAPAAPIPPVGPFDISGTISEVQWVPERTVKGIPRLSGSAGRDRVEAPHFLVTLVDYAGVTPAVAITMTRYLEGAAYKAMEVKSLPPFIRLKIDHPDRNFLQKGLRIRVTGYRVAGDEGGTWTTFSGIHILQEDSLNPRIGSFIQNPVSFFALIQYRSFILQPATCNLQPNPSKF